MYLFDCLCCPAVLWYFILGLSWLNFVHNLFWLLFPCPFKPFSLKWSFSVNLYKGVVLSFRHAVRRFGRNISCSVQFPYTCFYNIRISNPGSNFTRGKMNGTYSLNNWDIMFQPLFPCPCHKSSRSDNYQIKFAKNRH